MKEYFVYIMTKRSKTLYTDVTNDLERKIIEQINENLTRYN